MGLDLNAMNADELKDLKKDLQKQMRAVERAMGSFKDRQRKAALAAAEKAVAELGFSLSDLTGGSKSKGAKSKSAPKYRNPDNPDQTWTGRGRRPDWIRDAMDKGDDLSKYEI